MEAANASKPVQEPAIKASFDLIEFNVASKYQQMIMEGKRQKIYVYRSRSILCLMSFPGGSDGKESSCNAEDVGSIPGLGGSLGERIGNPLQYCCLGNPMDR